MLHLRYWHLHRASYEVHLVHFVSGELQLGEKAAKPVIVVWDGVPTCVSVTPLDHLKETSGELSDVFVATKTSILSQTWSFPNTNRVVLCLKVTRSYAQCWNWKLNPNIATYLLFTGTNIANIYSGDVVVLLKTPHTAYQLVLRSKLMFVRANNDRWPI